MKTGITAIVMFLILQSFALGWFSGMNLERSQWEKRYIECQGDIERERTRNEVLADLVGP